MFQRFPFAIVLASISCLVFEISALAADKKLKDLTTEKLIDELQQTSEAGVGYSLYSAGSQFLPYADSTHVHHGVIGAMGTTPSDAIRELVTRGPAAVPLLLKHLDDSRPLKMKPVKGMMWMSFDDEYDYNRRTARKKPEGVNRDELFKGGGDRKHPDEHQLTVGDLCFVALGQIVNRGFTASRYQATGGLIVSSPSYSERLRKAVRAEWEGLTVEKHRALLIEDFTKADYEGRQQGAYLRLAFYYPDSLEAIVVKELNRPTYDVFVVGEFCRSGLYTTKDAALRDKRFKEFVRQHGAAGADGIRSELFDDLDDDRFAKPARELLGQLFSLPATVTQADEPSAGSWPTTTQARFIKTLTHDRNPKIGDRVKAIFERAGDDQYLANACLLCLASRGYAQTQIEVLGRIDWQAKATSRLHREYLTAIVTTTDPAVRAKLLEYIQKTNNRDYFVVAVTAVDPAHDAVVLQHTRRLIADLPADSFDGVELLQLVHQRFPKEAREIFQQFLKPNTPARNGTLCDVLWYGDPLAPELIGPMLSDERLMSDRFNSPTRVCERAAYAVSHYAKDIGREIRYSSDDSRAEQSKVIEQLKQFCQEQRAKSAATR